MFEKTVDALRRRGYDAVAVATRDEAKAIVMKEAGIAASVGWGGSETIKEIGVRACHNRERESRILKEKKR